MDVPERTSCSGLTASDTLGAFAWLCDGSVNPVRFISTGFKQDKGLSDLIDFSGSALRGNALVVLDGATQIAHSLPTIWWSNPVAVNNDGGDMTTIGTIYIVTNPTNVNKYAIGANKVALVTEPPNVILAVASALSTQVVIADTRSFLWVEVKVNATALGLGLSQGIFLTSTSHSVLHNVVAYNSSGLGVDLDSSSNNRLSNISVNNNSGSGVRLTTGSLNNRLSNIVARENVEQGITVSSSSNNNSLSAITSSGNTLSGIQLRGSHDTKLSNVTANGNNIGIEIDSSTNSYLGNVIVSHNTTEGLYMYGSSDNSLINNLTATADSNYGIRLEGNSNNTFTGVLQVGNNVNGDCSISGGTYPGLVNVNCTVSGTTGSSDYPAGYTSDATLTTGVSVANSFVNASAGNYSLKLADSAVRARLTTPTGTDVMLHTWSDASTTTMLRNAVEISGDGIGNDNLLCESDETCLYTPNFGAYQGHGNLISAGTFTGGTLSGITLLRYVSNGF